MAPIRVQRGVAKSGSKSCIPHCSVRKPATPKRKRLSRELAGLVAWSGWKGLRNDTSEDEDIENERERSLFSDEEKVSSTELTELADLSGFEHTTALDLSDSNFSGDSGTRESDDLEGDSEIEDVKLAQSVGKESREVENLESSETFVVSEQVEAKTRIEGSCIIASVGPQEYAAALAGPKCPLCICPINGVFFPVIQCEDCDRMYHQRCIGYGSCPDDHPFDGQNISKRCCEGCGCPDGSDFVVYSGYPGILFHRRDQDLKFREYFSKGRSEEAKHADLV